MTTPQKTVTVNGTIHISNTNPFTLFAGPCAIEGRDHALMMSEKLVKLTNKLGIPYVYKSSFDKANRTSVSGARGIGMEEGLRILEDVKAAHGCPVLTDVHTPDQAATVAASVDIVQTPAFLCRQTDFLVAVGKAGKPINVKKGQWLAPWDMQHVAAKIASTGNDDIMLCERGFCLGYNTWVSDMRGLKTMAETGYPVVFDATHSIQMPGGQGTCSGGQREMVPVVSRAAVAVGVAAVFMETHQEPDTAPCDGPNMVPLHEMEHLLTQLKALDSVVKG